MLKIFYVFAFAFLLVMLKVPLLIKISNRFQLYDELDKHRKRKGRKISRLGGLTIFSGLLISIFTFLNTGAFEMRVLIVAIAVLSMIGLKDDAFGGLAVIWKFIAHIAVALFLVFFGNLRITSLYGLFYIYQLSAASSILVSTLAIVFIINSFNLIDGIDGLAATISVIASLTFGSIFMVSGVDQLAFLAFCLAGITASFLKYNYSPAKIFMGDTGSTIIGLVIASMTINFINLHKISKSIFFSPDISIVISLAILIIPTFDTTRIFLIRLTQGRSPFKGDMNHIHHRLGKLGLSDGQAVILLALLNILVIYTSLSLAHLSKSYALLIVFGIAISLNAGLTLLIYNITRTIQKCRIKPLKR